MQLDEKESESREVSARARETGDEAGRNGVVAAGEDDWDCGGGSFRRACSKVAATCGDQVDLAADELRGQRRQPIVLALRPAVLDLNVLALDITGVLEALPERGNVCCKGSWRPAAEIADHRPRRERPKKRRHGRRGAQQRYELAASHSITSSARARNVSGMVSPIAFAVLRLTNSSNLVGCSTGRSAGFAPCRILSTSDAARRYL